MHVTEEQAAARARAALGREPQDALEAAVALEAWGGLRPDDALALAHEHRWGEQPAAPTARDRGAADGQRASRRESLGLLLTLLGTMVWVGPLSGLLGPAATGVAWRIALVIALAAQWTLRRRHLHHERGLGGVRHDRVVLGFLGLALAAVSLGLAASTLLLVVAALVLVWVGGLLVVVRGWGPAYGLGLLASAGLLELGVPVLVDILAVVLGTVALVGAALWTTPQVERPPTAWPRSLAAGLLGAMTGAMVLLDQTIDWSSTRPFPVVALLPSLLASVWGSAHLARVWTDLTDRLASTAVLQRAQRPSWPVFAGIVGGAVLRLVLGTAAASALLYVGWAALSAVPAPLLPLLVGVGCFGLVNFLVAVLEAFGRVAGSLATATAALLGTLSPLAAALPVGGSLAAGAVVASLVVLVPFARLVRSPERTMATMV